MDIQCCSVSGSGRHCGLSTAIEAVHLQIHLSAGFYPLCSVASLSQRNCHLFVTCFAQHKTLDTTMHESWSSQRPYRFCEFSGHGPDTAMPRSEGPWRETQLDPEPPVRPGPGSPPAEWTSSVSTGEASEEPLGQHIESGEMETSHCSLVFNRTENCCRVGPR